MGWPPELGRVILETVDSTNTEALRRIGQGDCWILTHAQPGGVGRRGKRWQMPKGNFAASLLMHSTAPLPELAQRSFVAALALYDVLAGLGVADISLKWPNDVLVQGRKLAGILLASSPGAVVVGIGVNLVAAPDLADLPEHALAPISLKEVLHNPPGAEGFLELLAIAFQKYEHQMRAYGFSSIRQAWLSHAARLGEVIHARLPERTLSGTFETIDEAGALVLATDSGRVSLPAAEVFF
ncbi:MAG: biotin--[acetyl-CoA-carboxylase] ligase [Rhodobacteraceae bacterium]|nr:biotin--[acetyl-CoA-carboxylase] ligase [Paracoccaceae bacterium]